MTHGSWMVLALSLLLLAAPASAQIDQFTWTLQGASGGSGNQTATNLHVVGPDLGGCTPPITFFGATADTAGHITVQVDFQNLDTGALMDHPDFDAPAYILNGVITNADPQPPGEFIGWPTSSYVLDFDVAAGDEFGLGVWSVDCFEGPGIADFHDLVFSAEAWSGQPYQLDPRKRISIDGVPFSQWPISVGAAGDVDADGVPDIIMGEGFSTVRVRSGADGSVVLELIGPHYSFGSSVAGVGDLDFDGHDDVIVGADNEGIGGFTANGSAYVYSGFDGSLLLEVHGIATFDRLGDQVAGIGDANDDGVPDFAVRADNPGVDPDRVVMYSGVDASILHSLSGSSFFTDFGETIAGGGDVDDDGHDDLLVALDHRARVYSGDTGLILWEFGVSLGEDVTVAAAGDVDGDGHADVAIGAPNKVNAQGNKGGRLRLHSGATGDAFFTVDGLIDEGDFGRAVAGGADLDGDGDIDVAASAPDDGVGGVVRIFDALTGEFLTALQTSGAGDGFGQFLVRLGDVDGDGQHDLAAGTDTDLSATPGYVRVFQNLHHIGAPVLDGSGDLTPGSPVAIGISKALPLQPATLVVGFSLVSQPVKGGILGPAPTLLIPVVTNASGALPLFSTWPAGLPIGTTVWMQSWHIDSDGPQGFSASNALSATQL